MGIEHFALFAQQLVIGDVLFGLAVFAAVGQELRPGQREGAVVEGVDQNLIPFGADGEDALSGLFDPGDIEHPGAGDADCIDLLPVKAVLGEELVEAVGVAGL